MEVLAADVWLQREQAHALRIDAATAGHRERRAAGRRHPVEDFLFTYYSHSPTALRRWHPGVGTRLAGAAGTERTAWRFYRVEDGGVCVDVPAFLAARGDRVRFVHRLLTGTLGRPAHLGCFGMHEWAMVHRLDEAGVRHPDWPLRLGGAGTDEVVEGHQLTCSHVDAFRFFTPSARPLNSVQPTRDRQVFLEQPGCLHAGMDCYKWAYQLVPAVPSDLVADCFDLARELRVLDMQASPYDLRNLGYDPILVETKAGKAAYLEAQRAFIPRANALRRRLIAVCEVLLEPQREARSERQPHEPSRV